jgi:hypothetical protein
MHSEDFSHLVVLLWFDIFFMDQKQKFLSQKTFIFYLEGAVGHWRGAVGHWRGTGGATGSCRGAAGCWVPLAFQCLHLFLNRK